MFESILVPYQIQEGLFQQCLGILFDKLQISKSGRNKQYLKNYEDNF